MDRIDYLKEKKYKMQGQLNSLYSNNGDIGQIQKVKSQINEINFEINHKKGNEISQNNQINKEKRDILLNLLIGNLINVPKIYRGIIIENILENEKKYYEMNDFYDDVNIILEFIKKQNRLNAIIINT